MFIVMLLVVFIIGMYSAKRASEILRDEKLKDLNKDTHPVPGLEKDDDGPKNA
jgi:hypothetical protein